jgi:hypothetical protein
MKQSHFLSLLLLGAALCSCTTYQYSARQTDVRQRPIDAKEQMASIDVNYAKQVTATSDYQMTKKDAIAEAEFRCIENAKVDVVVDPIFRIEYNPFKFKKRFKATIVGYAGMYKKEDNRLDDSKKYTLEEIEKFKLLYDAEFPKYYYQKGEEGDRYFFNSGASRIKENRKPANPLVLNSSKSPRAKEILGKAEKKRSIYQGYLELAGYVGTSYNAYEEARLTMGGPEISNTHGCRFNEYAFLGAGFGFSSTISIMDGATFCHLQIPIFVDVRAYCPTPKKGMYPFLGISVGPQFRFYSSGEGTSNAGFDPQAYFRLYGGFDYKRFTMSVGYQLFGTANYKQNFFVAKLGIRLGRKNMYN